MLHLSMLSKILDTLKKEKAIENIPEQCWKIILISPMCQAINPIHCTVPDYLLDTVQFIKAIMRYNAVFQGKIREK
jgi:hypothetical protein